MKESISSKEPCFERCMVELIKRRAKVLRLSAGDHVHSGSVVGKLEGEREVTLGDINDVEFLFNWIYARDD